MEKDPDNLGFEHIASTTSSLDECLEPSAPAPELLGSFGDCSAPEKMPIPELPDQPVCTASVKPATCSFMSSIHPSVIDMIYWRNPKHSGPVFGGLLTVLLSINCCSIISVVSHLLLAVLAITLSYRLYCNLLQALKKEPITNPFAGLLDMDLKLTMSSAEHVAEPLLKELNFWIHRLRAVFLVQDIIDSLKHGVIFWIMCYVGMTFNLLTLVILGVVAVFTLPKIYELYQGPIDNAYEQARNKLVEVSNSVRAKVPFLNKEKPE